MKTRNGLKTLIFLLLSAGMVFIFNNCTKSGDDSTPTPTPVTDVDGNVYHTVTIGTQVWMVENLKTTKLNDGTAIPQVTDTSWRSLSTPAYCYYGNDAGWKPIYGPLYNWWAVNSGKLAPAGWHVATESDWNLLVTTLGGDTVAGGKLKSTGTVESITGLWLSPNKGATNASGFTAFPGGYRYYSIHGIDQINRYSYWWTSTSFGTSTAYCFFIRYDETTVNRDNSEKHTGYTVRCV